MKRLATILLLALLAVSSAAVFIAEARAPQQGFRCHRAGAKAEPRKVTALHREFKSSLPIPEGEKLVYEVKLSRFPIYITVGKVTFEFLGRAAEPGIKGINLELKPAEDPSLIHLRAEAVSHGLLARIFGLDVNDRFETLVDAHDFGARLSFKEVDEGKRHYTQTAVFEREKQLVKYTDTEPAKPEAPARERVLAIEDGTLDLLSAFYFVRLQKLKEGEWLRFPVSNNAENYQFDILVHKREKLETGQGKFRTVKIEPKLFGPGQLFAREGEMFLWLTDDERRLPVRLVAKTGAGTLTATLVQTENLKDEKRQKSPTTE